MSTKVAIICEDHTDDRYILEPIVAAALKAIGIPRPRVACVTNPRMQGFSTLMAQLCDAIKRYHKTVSVVVVAFDLDGEDGQGGRPDRAARVRNAISACDVDADNVVILGSVMEAEVYALWGQRGALGPRWSEVRSERDPKEAFFQGLQQREDELTTDGGRTRLVRSSLQAGWESLSGGCPELKSFQDELRAVLGS